jgi:uncharacterized repeat protein (TIGR01451 family)
MDPNRKPPAPRRAASHRLVLALLVLWGAPALAQTPISLFRNFVGHVNYEATGGSLRAQPNTANACSLNGTSVAPLGGIPSGAAVRAAYLYWAGSGSSADTTVSLNGTPVAADRVFSDTYFLSGTSYDFFSGFADVTGLIPGNGSVRFAGLSVDNGSPYCGVQAVVAGWALIVVYDHPSEDLRAVNVFDGFALFRASQLTLGVDTFRIPPAPVNGKVTHITWEGDPQNSGSQDGVSERLTFNGTLVDDGLVPPGSSPTVQQFDGTINSLGSTTAHGVDVDTYDVSALLAPGDTSATTTYSAGQDLVLLSAEVISFTTEPIVDLAIDKSHGADFVAGGAGSYLLRVSNNGPEDEVTPVTVQDILPGGLAYATFAGALWSCSVAGQDVRCTHPGPVPAGTSLPDLTLTVQAASNAPPTVSNFATVSSASFDGDSSNDTSTDPTAILGGTSGGGTKTLYLYDTSTADPNGFDDGPRPYLSRTPPASGQNDVDVDRNDPSRVFTLTPALPAALTLDAGTIPVTLYLSKGDNGFFPGLRALTVELATTGGPLGGPVAQTFFAPRRSDPIALTFDVPLAPMTTVPAGEQIELRLTNVTFGGGTQRIRVHPVVGADFSRIDLNALTVINVDTAETFDAPYPGGTAAGSFAPPASVVVRADVSDPFGRFDIAAVALDVRDANGAAVLTGRPMARVQALDGARARYELVLDLPAAAALGTWTYRVTAIEGSEGIVTHTHGGTFAVGGPQLTVTKSVATLADAHNGTVNPKAIPGALMIYSVTIANSAAVAVDAGSLEVRDTLPPDGALYVATGGGDPIAFLDGTPPSGLAYDYAAHVRFSSQVDGGPPFDYTPVPDAQGFDTAVTGFRVAPLGGLAGAGSAGSPSFELRYRLRID